MMHPPFIDANYSSVLPSCVIQLARGYAHSLPPHQSHIHGGP